MFKLLRAAVIALGYTTQTLTPLLVTAGPRVASLTPAARVVSVASFALTTSASAQGDYGAGTPTPDYQEFQDYAREQGRRAIGSSQQNADGTFTFNPDALGQGERMSVDEMFQTEPSQAEVDALRDFDGNHNAILLRAYEDAEDLDAQVQQPDSTSPPTAPATARGEAYRVLKESEDRARPDLSTDPLITRSNQLLSERGDLIETFGDCSTTTVSSTVGGSSRVPDYKFCEKINTPNQREDLYHDYEVFPFIELVNRAGGGASPVSQSGSATCGPGCIEIYVGQIGDNYWTGTCTEHVQNVQLRIIRPEALISASIIDIRWDDHTQLTVNGDVVFTSPDGYPQPGPSCELETSNVLESQIDITSAVRSTSIIDFTQKTQVARRGEAYSVVRILYDPKKLLDDRGYFPESAYTGARNLDDTELCSNSSAIRQDNTEPQGIGPGQCATFHGNVTICPSDFTEPEPTVQMSPFWRHTLITSSCEPQYGTYCWTDVNGVQQCFTQTPDNTNNDNCPELENDPNCGFISSQCVEGASGSSTGHCYVTQFKYDCGLDVDTSFTATQEQTSCGGAVQCLGESCYTQDRELSNEFAQATAALAAVRQIAVDSQCNPETGKCFVFPGEALECKKAAGGVQDCCENPGPPTDFTQYITVLLAMDQINSAVGGLEVMQPIYGAWDAFRGTVAENFSSVWSEVTQPFTSILDGIGGGTVSSTTTTGASGAISDTAASTFLSETKQFLMEKTYDFLSSISEQLANSLIDASASSGGSGATSYALSPGMQSAANFAGGVMAAYAAYQAALLLIQVVFACEDTELQLAVKKDLKVCEPYGSYCKTSILGGCIETRYASCCYNSPLSRIMMTQIHQMRGTGPVMASARQIGSSTGSVDQPFCQGLSIEDIDQVDFNEINLDEWIAILTLAGTVPTSSNGGDIDERYSMEAITGAGSRLDTAEQGGPARANAADRTIERANTINPSQTNQNISNYFWNGDAEAAGQSNQPENNSAVSVPNQTGYTAP